MNATTDVLSLMSGLSSSVLSSASAKAAKPLRHVDFAKIAQDDLLRVMRSSESTAAEIAKNKKQI